MSSPLLKIKKELFTSAHLQTLKKFVEKSILEFVLATRVDKDLRFDPAYTQSWINITRQFGFQERHNG
jgi:hypothetical protein